MPAIGFGISEDDIETVLRQNSAQVVNSQRLSFEALAALIFDEWSGGIEHDQIEAAALDGGLTMDEQTTAAYAEIRQILVESGHLKS